MPDLATRRAVLSGYLARSRRVRRIFGRLGQGGIAITVALGFGGAGGGAVVAALGLTAIVAGSGVWITHGHIADFERQLAALAPPRVPGAVRPGAGDAEAP